MDDKDRKTGTHAGVDTSSDMPQVMPLWDPNLIWDEGGWPVGCVDGADARQPEKAAS
ncbi:hypothetical protein ACFQU7_21640 [Pseudoroseomonas wenyumeiae]